MLYSAGGVEGKVDLLTAGSVVSIIRPSNGVAIDCAQAHWFDMTRFWVSAAKAVKSGKEELVVGVGCALILFKRE